MKSLRLLLALAFLARPVALHSEEKAEAKFRAGAATSNITPDLGSPIVGGFVPFPASHVHDELHARCLVLDDGKTMLAFVVCDLLGMHRSVSVEARKLIQEATGIPPERVMISCTHTHSAATALGEKRYVSEQPLDDKRTELLPPEKLGPVPRTALTAADHAKNNLPDILARWRTLHPLNSQPSTLNGGEAARPRTAQSFCVPKADLAAQGYDLSLNRYKEVVHAEVAHRPPGEILAALADLEKEIVLGMRELETMLEKPARAK